MLNEIIGRKHRSPTRPNSQNWNFPNELVDTMLPSVTATAAENEAIEEDDSSFDDVDDSHCASILPRKEIASSVSDIKEESDITISRTPT